jgi:DNA-binding Lrp family transcriptional regulator
MREQILQRLQENSRLTAGEVAVMVGASAEAVAAEIRALETEGIILKYTALVDWEKAGVENVVAMIEVKVTPQRDVGFDKVAERIYRFPEVRSVFLISGTYDLSVQVEAPTLKEVSRFVAERLSTIPGVAGTTTHFIMKRYKVDGVVFGRPEEDHRLPVAP